MSACPHRLIRKTKGPDAPSNFVFSPTDAAAMDALSLDEVVAKYCPQSKLGKTSQFKGVSWSKSVQKWRSFITGFKKGGIYTSAVLTTRWLHPMAMTQPHGSSGAGVCVRVCVCVFVRVCVCVCVCVCV